MENLRYTEFAFGDGEGYYIRFTGNELNNVITIPGLWYSSSTELDGGDGNDELHAAGGYSTFRFSAGSGNYGNDTLHGAGSATIDFADARSAIVADLNAGTMSGGGTGGSGSAVLHDIHNLI